MARFEISKSKVYEQYDKIKEMCDCVSYSSKTNPFVTHILEKNTESLFSIHVKTELENVHDKSRVVYLAQGWDEIEIGKLVDYGVRWFVIDNKPDLDVFEEFIEKWEGEKLNLMLRMKLKENTLKTERYFVFGFDSGDLCDEIVRMKENFGGKLASIGIHFHRKTQNMAEWSLKEDFKECVSEEVLGIVDWVCIGGGLPSEYANTNIKVLKGIFKKIGEFKDYLGEKKIKMMIEPGRFIAGPAGKLVCKIKNVYDNTIVVDGSVYNGDMDALIVPVKLKVEGELDKSDINGKGYVIKGCTPCSMDLFRYKVYLDPSKVKVGEEIVFCNAGAYNFHSDFCDLAPLTTEVVE